MTQPPGLRDGVRTFYVALGHLTPARTACPPPPAHPSCTLPLSLAPFIPVLLPPVLPPTSFSVPSLPPPLPPPHPPTTMINEWGWRGIAWACWLSPHPGSSVIPRASRGPLGGLCSASQGPAVGAGALWGSSCSARLPRSQTAPTDVHVVGGFDAEVTMGHPKAPDVDGVLLPPPTWGMQERP